MNWQVPLIDTALKATKGSLFGTCQFLYYD
jgi:hypothetical protein